MRNTLVTLLITALMLIFLDKIIDFAWARNFFQVISKPIETGFFEGGLRLHQGLEFALALPSIYQENQKLKAELTDRMSLLQENATLKQENEVLKEQLGVKHLFDQHYLQAAPLGKLYFEGAEVILIDQGSLNGVGENQIVVIKDLLVGRVMKVFDSVAYVLPITSSQSKIPAKTLDSEKPAKGLAVGEFNARLLLTQVMPGEELRVGDVVVTSGEGGVFQTGLLLGRIKKIHREDNKLYQSAELLRLWDVDDLKVVFILQ